MPKSIGMAEVPGALGFGAINRPINAVHPSLGILADELTSTFRSIEGRGVLSKFLPELVVEFGCALAITQRELMLYVIEMEYGPSQ